jgi:DNA-binding NarL/FixJ family response regulator
VNIKVLLADDHKIVRDGLRNLLEAQPDIDVIDEAENGRMAVQLAGKLSPDIVIIDIAMPGLNGIEATCQMLQHNPATKIIALSMHSDKRFVGEMLKAGASAYLLKDCAFEELVTAIRAVLANKTYLSPMIGSVIVESFVRRPQEEAPSAFSLLTKREREVLQLLAEGKNTKEIADRLYVSVKTVETHRTHIMEKVHVRTVAELTKYAIREGITSL